MRFARVRSGVPETFHEVLAYAVDRHGTEVYTSGEVGTPFFYRSAIKPFQALAARRAGVELPPEHLAVTCASHGGYPVHLAIVEEILDNHGLTTNDLGCATGRPLSAAADRLQLLAGNVEPEPRFHNCSGKHAGWLAACTVVGWDRTTYLDPSHPLQRSILDVVSDVTGQAVEPVGVDGCGAPTLNGSVIGLARAFARLGSDPELEPMADAMTRFGALVADNVRGEGRVAVALGGPSKGGAEGLFAMTLAGISIATKSLDGAIDIAVAAALDVAEVIGVLPRGTREWLDEVRRPPVIGGGRRVGSLEPIAS